MAIASRDLTGAPEIGSIQPSAPATKRRAQVSWPVVGALLTLMMVSSVAHLWALHRNLPVPDIDEPFFVGPAVHIPASGDPNPGWFGHPGSTVIYPLAGLFHVWDVVAHHGPIFTSNPALVERFHRSPSEFYVIGRLWTIALSVGALPLLFLVGRRAFSTRVALVATAIYAVLPLPVQLGRVVRSDSAAVFFGLLALWLCLRLLDESRTRWCVIAGAAVGLAVSSRYFMVTLIPVLVAAAMWPDRRAIRHAIRAGGIALASAVGGFAVSSPYFFLDWRTAIDSLQAESAGPVPSFGPTGLSPTGNLRWYLGTAIPEALTWPLVALAAVGIVLILRRRRARQLLLMAFCALFLAGICVSNAHWNRWILPMLPVVVLFAAVAVDAITRLLVAAIPHFSRTSIAASVVLAGVTTVLVLHPFGELIAANRNGSGTSAIANTTRQAARDWVVSQLPSGTRILQDSDTLPVNGASVGVHRFNPRTRTLAHYLRAGYQYILINGSNAAVYRFNATHHPREARFYQDVACHTRLRAVFPRTFLELKGGGAIRIYHLEEQPKEVSDYLCTQHADD